jgi:RNA polymerase sigma-54 factor
MKQSLELRLGQHLAITPQLQQAIRLLQLSTVELQQEIREALEKNPLLEEIEDGAGEPPVSAEAGPAVEPGPLAADTASAPDESGTLEAAGVDEPPEETALDADAWEFPDAGGARTRDDDGPATDLDARNSLPQDLHDQLRWQMQMTRLSDSDRDIAEALIDAINDDGYLTADLEEIRQAVGGDPPPELDEIEAVLHQIQNFEPLGVGARDLSECLRLQLRPLDPATPGLAEARLLATPEHLALLARRDYTQLRRLTKLRPETLKQAVQLIQSLNPRPGANLQPTQTNNYIVPDILVRKVRGQWRAELNGGALPRLRINAQYRGLIHRGRGSADNKYLQERLQEARWLIKSLASRNDTLLKVARAILERQRAFLDHGPEALRPLVLRDIAEAVSMHESTISRVTSQKYMLTPRGIFELKYFFSSHVHTVDGGTCSATAIRSLIKKLVEVEPADNPVSDSAIAEILAKQGISVARRTVAKYRESLHIPPSNQRKSLV